jgi:hypothetical protein
MAKEITMTKPYQQHLKSSKSLETTYEAVRAGFVALALEKNRRATPFVAQARALKAAAGKSSRACSRQRECRTKQQIIYRIPTNEKP